MKPPVPEPTAGRGLARTTLDMLVCPVTKTRLSLTEDRTELVSRAARLAFPIRNDVPMLTIEEARPLTEDECRRFNCT